MGRGITRVSVPVVRCENPDHIAKNHGSNAPQIFHRDEFPEVSVEKKFGGGISVYMRWTGHLRLPESDDTTSKQLSARIAADTMRQRLEQFRRGSPAEFIAPQLLPGRLMEMQCFDPNRCSCLQYSGSDLLPGHKWQLSPPGQSQQAICRTDPSNQQSCLHLQTSEGSGPQGKSRGQLPLGPSTKISMCGRSGTPDASVVRIWMDCCPGDVDNSSRCLRIKYERVIKIVPTYVTKEHTPDLIMLAPISAGRPLPMSAAWCQALDPDSYESSNHENILCVRVVEGLAPKRPKSSTATNVRVMGKPENSHHTVRRSSPPSKSLHQCKPMCPTFSFDISKFVRAGVLRTNKWHPYGWPVKI
ncbi:hypothetical protein J7T55_014774 [Diaporthe amygdali]|uniref:uncharacterized protein n=1 Tax=Phomopsis amygdali TaxID=1214568 RepID=UPI0022FE8978|nr:uncharacterized protein J7T55_014774 [Diaporthe amygdali]KAJ0109972.1 hypothetical protein J7T55_014774 [Diaporthe amygdali]